MVQSVANQMVERCFETVEYVAVDAGGLAHHLESGLLAKLSGQVADQPWKATDSISQRPHPAGQNLVVQPARKILALAGKLLDRLDRLSQLLQALGSLCLGRGQSLSIGGGQCVFSDLEMWSSRTCSDLEQSRLLSL